MEEFAQKIAAIFQSPQMIALITAAFSFLSANFITIITFAIKYIKLKNKEIKEKMLNEQTQMALKAEYEAQTQAFFEKIDNRLNEVEGKIEGKLEDIDAEKAKMIEEQTVMLKKAVNQTKKQLTIDDALDAADK